jgi:hypothetical protein
VLQKIDRLALDCGELAVELHAMAAARLEVMLSTSREELLAMLNAADLETVEDPWIRDQLEAGAPSAISTRPRMTIRSRQGRGELIGEATVRPTTRGFRRRSAP